MDLRKDELELMDIEEFQVRGVTGSVKKVQIGSRTVDFWHPEIPSGNLIVAFDGQNMLDKRNIGINPHQRATWRLAESAIKIANKNHVAAPTIICVYHTAYNVDNLGRLKEYTPKKYMNKSENWMIESHGLYSGKVESFIDEINSDELISEIVESIVPAITSRIGQGIPTENNAILGASMGGLAAIYSSILKPDFFRTTLSFSPHWVIGGNALAEKMMSDFPAPAKHKLWMSRGTKGLDSLYEQSQDLADKIIKTRGYVEQKNLISRVLKRGAHSNASWARYLPAALDFWLKEGK